MQAMSKFRITIVGTMLTVGLCAVTIAADTTPVLDAVNVSFELLNRDGEVVREADFQGQNLLLAFGFTHCLHICPLIAANMANVLKMAKKDAVGVFISVDTERDSAAIVDEYAHGFSDQMMGLGGSYEQVSAAVNNFNATFVVTKTSDNYTVQHTPSIFLIGPDGKLIDVFAMNTTSKIIADAMK